MLPAVESGVVELVFELGCGAYTHLMSRKAEVAAMRAAAKDLDAMIAEWGASADELMEECREIRRRSRGKKRDANRALVLDANMLIRAFLGKRVRRDMAGVAAKRGGDVDQAHWGPS